MSYTIQLSDTAEEDAVILKKSEPAAYAKLQKLFIDIAVHPYTGIGKPEIMKYEYSGCYSRRITQKHRIVYRVIDATRTVFVLSAYKHYGNK